MTDSNKSAKKKLPRELENHLPSEVRRTLLKAAWVAPMITVINIPAHAQTSPAVIITSLVFTGADRDGEITGTVEEASTKSASAFTLVSDAFAQPGADFTGWTVELEVTVTRTKDVPPPANEESKKMFTVPVNADGSFTLPLSAGEFFDSACGDDENENSLVRIDVKATLFDPDGNERDVKPLTEIWDGDGNPGQFTLVGTYPCPSTTPG